MKGNFIKIVLGTVIFINFLKIALLFVKKFIYFARKIISIQYLYFNNIQFLKHFLKNIF